MRRTLLEGLSIEVPEAWAIHGDEQPVRLAPPDADAPIQLSRLNRPEERRSAPTEKSVVGWVFRIAHRLADGDLPNSPTATPSELPDDANVVHVDTWATEESVCGWFEIGPRDDSPAAYAIGFREWYDTALMLTWIGSDETIGYRVQARAVFDSVIREA